MDMYSSHSVSLPESAKNARNRKIRLISIWTLSGIVLVFLLFILKPHDRKAKTAEIPANDTVAELVSASGLVFVGKPGRNEWQQVTVGARLMEGDLVQTDSSAEASIRYADGSTVSIQANTVFTVRNAGDGGMEISVPSPGAEHVAFGQTVIESDQTSQAGENEAKKKEARPFIKLDRVIPFGRSLELIGSVEAGSRLTVNSEIVEVDGNGSFKHFTNPFPVTAQKVRVVMKVTDLAGRIRIVTTTHDFDPQGGDR